MNTPSSPVSTSAASSATANRKYRPSAARRCAEQRDEHLRADERAAHENFRVGKIDKMEYAVDHHVPQRDNRIHEAELQAVDEHLRQ